MRTRTQQEEGQAGTTQRGVKTPGTFIPISVKLCSLSFFCFQGCGTVRGAGDPHSAGGSYLLVFTHDFTLRSGGGRHSFVMLHTHVRLPAFSLSLSPVLPTQPRVWPFVQLLNHWIHIGI
jgi:hypothetical protein